MIPVNPYPPLVFKDSFEFKDSHLSAAKEILSYAKHQGINYLEQGNARSSVSNQQLPPHKHPAFQDYFEWQNQVAEKIILEMYKLSKSFEYVVGNSWVNLHQEHGVTLEHAHGLSALSCVAYISLPFKSGYTEFKDPHYDLRSLHERSDNDAGLREWCEVPAQPGDVLFFPGWLQHRSQPNFSLEDRWILSSNYVNFTSLEALQFKNLWSN